MIPSTSAENLKISTGKQSLPIGKCGHLPKYGPPSISFRLLLTFRLANQLPFHALGISSSLPKYVRGILDIVPLIVELCVSLQFSTIPLLHTYRWFQAKMCNRTAVTRPTAPPGAQYSSCSFKTLQCPLRRIYRACYNERYNCTLH